MAVHGAFGATAGECLQLETAAGLAGPVDAHLHARLAFGLERQGAHELGVDQGPGHVRARLARRGEHGLDHRGGGQHGGIAYAVVEVDAVRPRGQRRKRRLPERRVCTCAGGSGEPALQQGVAAAASAAARLHVCGLAFGGLTPMALALPRVGGQGHITARCQHTPPVGLQAQRPQASEQPVPRDIVAVVAMPGAERCPLGPRLRAERVEGLLDGGLEHGVRAEFDEHRHAVGREPRDGVAETHCLAQVGGPVGARGLLAGQRCRVHGGVPRNARSAGLQIGQFGSQCRRRAVHLRTVRGHVHLHRAAEHLFALEGLQQFVHRRRIARDDA